MKILIINGPNLNLLGKREPEIYGNQGFEVYLEKIKTRFTSVEVSYYQSNVEGELVTALQEAETKYGGIVLNAAAYTHTSLAIADAVRAIMIPVVEVHISNTFARESYRHKSFIAPYAKGVIAGFGLNSYALAIQSFIANEG